MIQFARIALRNIFQHWRQSFAALISIVASFIALVIFQGYMEDAVDIIIEEFTSRAMNGDVVLEKTGLLEPEGRFEPWKYWLTTQDQQYINKYLENDKRVDLYMRTLRMSGMISNGQTEGLFWGLAIEKEKSIKLRGKNWAWNVLYGVPFELVPKPEGVVVGQGMGHLMGCVPTPKQQVLHTRQGYAPLERKFACSTPTLQLSGFTQSGQINALDVEVVGIIDGGFPDIDNREVILSLDLGQRLYNTKDVTFYSIRLKNSEMTDDFVVDFQKDAKAQGFNYQIASWRQHPEIGDMYRRTTDLLSIFRNFVVVVILSISTLSVLNTMIKIVSERTREIGTLRSLGFKNNSVMSLFAIEAMLLALIGCLIGMSISYLISKTIGAAEIFYKAGLFVEPVPLGIKVTPQLYFASAAFLTFLTVCTALISVRNTLKKKIFENLTYV